MGKKYLILKYWKMQIPLNKGDISTTVWTVHLYGETLLKFLCFPLFPSGRWFGMKTLQIMWGDEYLTMPQITTIGEPNIARLAISTVSSIDRGYQDWLHHAMLCSRNKKDKAVKPTLIETLLSCAHRWRLFNGANYLHFPHCSFWTFSSSITVTIVSFKQRKRNSILEFHAWKSWRC